MGSIIVPGQASPPSPSAEDIIFKIIFEPEGDARYSLFENLNFEPHKRGALVSVAGEPDRGSLIKLFGNMVNPSYYWDMPSGKLDYGDVEPAGFYALGRYSPNTSLLSMLDILDAGREFQYSGAGKETVEHALRKGHRAYGPGHETMLRNLMAVPAIANMVKGLDPKTGSSRTRNAHIVQDVLRAHKDTEDGFGYEYTTKDSKGKKVVHNTAFDTLPKLMAFLVTVNEEFNEKRGADNPLFDLLSSDLLDIDVLADGGNHGQMRFLLRRNGGESDEDFYSRQLEDINRYRRDEEGVPELSYEQYYNWIIDRMVRNIESAAKALAGKEAELNAKGEGKAVRARMYQMAVRKEDVLTIDQLMEKGGDLSPLVNGSMKIVSTGILLDNTGMDLKQVKAFCKKYFSLRSLPGKESNDSARIFEEIFGVDPMRVP